MLTKNPSSILSFFISSLSVASHSSTKNTPQNVVLGVFSHHRMQQIFHVSSHCERTTQSSLLTPLRHWSHWWGKLSQPLGDLSTDAEGKCTLCFWGVCFYSRPMCVPIPPPISVTSTQDLMGIPELLPKRKLSSLFFFQDKLAVGNQNQQGLFSFMPSPLCQKSKLPQPCLNTDVQHRPVCWLSSA